MYVAMQLFHITKWNDELKRSAKAEMPFRTTSVEDDQSFIMTMQGETPLLLSPLAPLAMGDSGTSIVLTR